jgi:hypothetical protein
MKFTWGHASVAIPVIIVVVFTSVLIRSMADDKKTELVTTDYYAKEIKFQEQIDKTKNALVLETELSWVGVGDNLELGLIGKFNPEDVTGELVVYRPSNASLDFTMDISLDSSGIMRVPRDKFKKGKYQIQLSWKVNDLDCYLNKNVFIQ